MFPEIVCEVCNEREAVGKLTYGIDETTAHACLDCILAKVQSVVEDSDGEMVTVEGY